MEHFPCAWAFFISFILAATFTLLNLYIVNAMQAFSEGEPKESVTALAQALRHAEVRALRGELAELKSLPHRSPR